jgi:hypothetical protein
MMAHKPTLIDWVLRPGRERRERVRAAEAKVERLVAEGGREEALRAIRSLRNLAHADPDARREAHALQAALDRLSPAPPRPPRTDTATRMLYRDD